MPNKTKLLTFSLLTFAIASCQFNGDRGTSKAFKLSEDIPVCINPQELCTGAPGEQYCTTYCETGDSLTECENPLPLDIGAPANVNDEPVTVVYCVEDDPEETPSPSDCIATKDGFGNDIEVCVAAPCEIVYDDDNSEGRIECTESEGCEEPTAIEVRPPVGQSVGPDEQGTDVDQGEFSEPIIIDVCVAPPGDDGSTGDGPLCNAPVQTLSNQCHYDICTLTGRAGENATCDGCAQGGVTVEEGCIQNLCTSVVACESGFVYIPE